MLVCDINWVIGTVRVISGGRTYTCPMEERDNDFYFRFKNQWHPVSQYASRDLDAQIKSHKQGVYQKRDSISQREFEDICRQVISEYPNVVNYRFERPGIVHIAYPSHSGRSLTKATLYFGVKGYITYSDWKYYAESNQGYFIGQTISSRIQSALYV